MLRQRLLDTLSLAAGAACGLAFLWGALQVAGARHQAPDCMDAPPAHLAGCEWRTR